MKKIIIFILLVLLISTGLVVNKIITNNKAWRLEVTNNFINVRSKPNQYEMKLGQVKKGKKYTILEMYYDDPNYVWYKIDYEKKQDCWIASSRLEPYVKEYNNPKNKSEDNTISDCQKPIIKYKELEYTTKNINTINYDHLEIIENTEYKITHTVYYEEKEPIEDSQYWINYEVIDAFDNKNKKLQKIVFEENPSPEEVKPFSEYLEKR